MVQELPRSASNKQQQQQQGDDRGDMPMEVMQEMANALGNMDETGMNGANSLAPILLWNLRYCVTVLCSWGHTGVAKPGDPPCMDACIPACLSGICACICCVISLMSLELFGVALQTFSR